MRLRKLHNAKEIIENNSFYIIEFQKFNKNWFDVFKNNNPIELEIGMGKGQFLISNALVHPNTNFVGIELNETICAKAIKKILKTPIKLSNLKIININANKLNDLFDACSISKIYLNFSDPWPKKRHQKNRLTSLCYLDIYKRILKKDGCIEMKSDNKSLFEFTISTLKSLSNVEIIYQTTNLYNDLNNQWNLSNITTEYEQKFISQNKPIYKIIFKFISN